MTQKYVLGGFPATTRDFASDRIYSSNMKIYVERHGILVTLWTNKTSNVILIAASPVLFINSALKDSSRFQSRSTSR